MRYLFILLTILLAACGTSSQGNAPQVNDTSGSTAGTGNFEVKLGTSNAATLGVSVFVGFDLVDQTDFTLDVTMPDGVKVNKTLDFEKPGKKSVWFLLRNSDDEVLLAQTGSYTFSANIDGRTLSRTASLAIETRLAEPQNVQVVNATSNAVTASWNPVPNAETYLVEIYSPSSGIKRGLIYHYVDTTQFTFEDYLLAPGAEYTFGVTALTADYNGGPPRVEDVSRFDISFEDIVFTVTQ